MMQKELLTKKNYAAVGEEISHETAADFINAFDKAYPGEGGAFGLGRNIIEKILAQPGCVGLRFHHALNEKGQKTLVYVGMDANGNDLAKQTMVTENGVMMCEEALIADMLQWWPK